MTYAAAATTATAVGALPSNPIVAENEKPGDPDWYRPAPAGRAIEGYASAISIAPGDTLELHVSVDDGARYRVDAYRLGWYDGAGARLVTCLPSCSSSEPGTLQPMPEPAPDTGIIQANWPVTDTLHTDATWVTGYYVAELVLEDGPLAGYAWMIPFIVRSPPGDSSPILVQAPVNTWAAYNGWGGKSLYSYNSTSGIAAVKVSFDRPFSQGDQSLPFNWEYQFVRFVEREGYDVSYTTDVDTDSNPSSLLQHRLVVSLGHDEYWTKAMRDGFEAAHAAGVNLAFIGADIGTWQMRYEDGGRTIVEYRNPALDPFADASARTGLFSSFGRSQCALEGVMYTGGTRHASDPTLAYVVSASAGSDDWTAGTGLTPGTVFDDLVGYEWDTPQPGCLPYPLTTILSNAGTGAAAVRYATPSGSQVFSAGSMQFTWALDDWQGHSQPAIPALQALMRNILDRTTGLSPPQSVTATPIASNVQVSIQPAADTQSGGYAVVRVNSSGFGTTICTTTATTCIDRAPPGHTSYTYEVFAVDDRGGFSRPSTSDIVAVPNHAPTVALRGPHSIAAGSEATIDCVVTDVDRDRLTFRWAVDGREKTSRSSPQSRLLVRPASGHHVVTVTVSDGWGGVTTRSFAISAHSPSLKRKH